MSGNTATRLQIGHKPRHDATETVAAISCLLVTRQHHKTPVVGASWGSLSCHGFWDLARVGVDRSPIQVVLYDMGGTRPQ